MVFGRLGIKWKKKNKTNKKIWTWRLLTGDQLIINPWNSIPFIISHQSPPGPFLFIFFFNFVFFFFIPSCFLLRDQNSISHPLAHHHGWAGEPVEIEFILGSLRRKMGCKKEKKNTEINMGKRIMNRKIVVANNKLLTDPGIFYYGRLINLFLVGHH